VKKRSVVQVGMMIMALFMAFSFSTLTFAAGSKVTGEVVKTEGEFVTVKDADGKIHKFHMDKTTKQTGDIKQGAQVEVEATPQGHASAIAVKGK